MKQLLSLYMICRLDSCYRNFPCSGWFAVDGFFACICAWNIKMPKGFMRKIRMSSCSYFCRQVDDAIINAD